LTGNKIPSLYLSLRCRDIYLSSFTLSSFSFFFRQSFSFTRRSLLAILQMRTLPARPSTRFRTELVLIRGMIIKNVALVQVWGSISGCWSVSKIFPLQKERYFTESRSLVLLSSPAFEHQIVDVLGGGGGSRKIIKDISRILLAAIFGINVVAIGGVMQLSQTLHHFFVGEMLVRDASPEVQNLPESNCESPHIALGRILSLKIRCNLKCLMIE